MEASGGLLLAGVEAGGTSFVAAVAKGTPQNIVHRQSFPTTTPEETLTTVAQWLKAREEEAGRSYDALGIASFGPVDLDPKSETYGYITTTPKPDWAQTDVLGAFKGFDCPKAFDTDVNGAAIAEGARDGHRTVAYVTVGTGVGVGIIAEGNAVHGVLHPEMGHIYVPQHAGDEFHAQGGTCPFHKGCLEGMVATGALAKRLDCRKDQLADVPDSSPVWESVGFYLAQLCVTLVLTVSPELIVFGGGVMQRKALFPIIRRHVVRLLNGYIKVKAITENIDEYIIRSPYNENAGIIGALEMARLVAHPQ
ncbi:Fructokinase [Balamuthia mandrillaris]